jgi:ubiquinone/menaquinone biosynthesis C-methylase UbiE
MYEELAGLYDVLLQSKDYYAASKRVHFLVQQHAPNAKTLLDVACGTGKHLEYLQTDYMVEGLDLSPQMLEIARQRCPEVTFHRGDMVDFDLDFSFDVITCLFCSIGYVKTVKNMERVVANMARHLRTGGIVVVEPWLTPTRYWVGKVTADVVDEPELKIVSMYTSEIEARLSVFDMNYLVGTPEGVEYHTERQELGLFTHEEYLGAFRKAGLESHYDPEGLFGYGLYFGTRKVTTHRVDHRNGFHTDTFTRATDEKER